ncbi:MAG: AtpZ/AtpI family protein [Candidatus Latescibacteria bacterium]|nr:AtpZ/AtpI family protein [Candidatus Latescibacterota bacterium]
MSEEGKLWRTAGEMSIVGLTLVVATTIGYFAGGWIGEKIGEATGKTWGGMIGALLGIAAGFIEVFRAVARYTRELEEEDRKWKQ